LAKATAHAAHPAPITDRHVMDMLLSSGSPVSLIQISNFRFQISNLKSRISDLFRISDFEIRVLKFDIDNSLSIFRP